MTAANERVLIWTVAKHCQPATLGEYQSKSRHLLGALQRMHPMFSELVAIGNERLRVPKELPNLDQLIETQLSGRKQPQEYLDLGPDGRLGPRSFCRIGFFLTYCSLAPGNESTNNVQDDGIELMLRGCSAGSEPSANVALQLPTGFKSDLHSPSSIKELLRICIDTWDCSFGGVSIHRYQQEIRGREPDSYAGQWLFYLPFSELKNYLPADIASEPFSNGILIKTTPHLPDADNPEDVAAGKRVRDALDDLGFIRNSTYAIAGWPPDREEQLYEQFISGAPIGRKYSVHCINFDGYDPDRKVLLYAKLFRPLRRHPKEWGLRGWDGPVLNEAKRQVRAAAKAGGVPIEWHIGFEEPAHQVRQLLADYTSITEQQLRVIYTPLDEALRSPPQ